MATQTVPRVDVGALACTIAIEAQNRIATVVSSLPRDDRDDEGLTEKQTAALLVSVLAAFDEFERSVAKNIIDDLHAEGIQTWGLSRALADLDESDHA